jgi:hypothetical protein
LYFLQDREKMRPVYIRACFCACLLGSITFPAVATNRAPSKSDVTVMVDFKGEFSPITLQAMEREASYIIGAAGIRLGWTNPHDAVNSTFNELVVMRFNGSCKYASEPRTASLPGPYASTMTTNGEVQPFGDVDCNRVVSSVQSVLCEVDYANAAILLGRALGRVVAHELVHMLTKSGQHAAEGIQKAALSGQELIGASLPLSVADLDRLRLERKQP